MAGVEVLIERLLDDSSCLAHLQASKTPKEGGRIILDGGGELQVVSRQHDLFMVKLLDGQALMDVLVMQGAYAAAALHPPCGRGD